MESEGRGNNKRNETEEGPEKEIEIPDETTASKAITILQKKITEYIKHIGHEREKEKKALIQFFLYETQYNPIKSSMINNIKFKKKQMFGSLLEDLLRIKYPNIELHTDEFNNLKNQTLENFEKSKFFDKSKFGQRLQNKDDIITDLNEIILHPPHRENTSKIQQQYIALKEWYNEPENKANLDTLESRRGESKLWDVLNAINFVFRKVILRKKDYKPITIGVTGVKVTESMHSYFQEKPEKKVNIKDQKPSKTPRSST